MNATPVEPAPPPPAHRPGKAGKQCPIRNPWIRRLGFLGFMFFLVKGLLWLAVPGALVTLGTCELAGRESESSVPE